MTESRMLVWVPAPVREVRPLLHASGVSSAVVIPVESGTVLVPRERIGLSAAAQWVHRAVRQLGKAVVIIGWNDRASMVYPITGAVSQGWGWGGEAAVLRLMAELGDMGALKRVGLGLLSAVNGSPGRERRQTQATERIAAATGADQEIVRRHVQTYEQHLAADRFLDEIGKPDVAALVRLTDAGRFDQWRTERSMMLEWRRAYLPALLLLFVVVIVVTVTVDPHAVFAWTLTYVVAPVLILAVMLFAWRRARYRTARMPIDEVLPVLQLPEASDNQSAK
ncbi:hypothetical protein [Kibdelosporangium phytohabitans]|uniref:Uncharacterized protein n=1 Tax=Kibdelosporangium phytohabitans TaxID=860235 RepID=A0A0N9HUF1_9PSEU|nr:hypothetical protein [Kibdelosporangium phytohabitans]ALG05570.1 hypothetical protein AOZ06_00280 [Kibdelosporangium phytohabitans]MBE1466469.1 hypothetical protein [Kibdelosporangium phytohabitans]